MYGIFIGLINIIRSVDVILLIGIVISLPWLIPYLRSPLDPDEREFLKEERKRKAREAEEAKKAQ